MKKRIAFVFWLIPLIIQGQPDQRIKDSLVLFAPTATGVPNSEPVSVMIGKEGGKLISADKKAELIIPPGALLSETMISIQPVTNMARTGIGKTYYFEPSGLQFKQPVQLIFHYTDKDTDEGSAQLLSVSTQDAKGSWLRLTKIKIDTVAKTITGNTTHFSGYVMSWSLVMWPHSNNVKVGKQIGVQCYLTPDNSSREEATDQQTLDAYHQWFDYQFQNPRNWSVNTIPNGDANVGEIIQPPIQATTWYDRFAVIYEAPPRIPDENPVTIEIEIKGVEMDGKFITAKRSVKLRVYDDCYQVEMIVTMKGGSRQAWGGNMTYKDDGSFVVSLDKKEPEILSIFNRSEIITYDNCPDRTILNPTTNSGMFHVGQTKQIKITPANLPDQPHRIIEILFEPFPIEVTRFTFNCPPPPGFKGGRSKGTVDLATAGARGPAPLLLFMGRPAIPQYLKFLAKEGEQIIMEMGKPGDEIYYKIWVRKIEEDRW
jgi:hypothetical protein